MHCLRRTARKKGVSRCDSMEEQLGPVEAGVCKGSLTPPSASKGTTGFQNATPVGHWGPGNLVPQNTSPGGRWGSRDKAPNEGSGPRLTTSEGTSESQNTSKGGRCESVTVVVGEGPLLPSGIGKLDIASDKGP